MNSGLSLKNVMEKNAFFVARSSALLNSKFGILTQSSRESEGKADHLAKFT